MRSLISRVLLKQCKVLPFVIVCFNDIFSCLSVYKGATVLKRCNDVMCVSLETLPGRRLINEARSHSCCRLSARCCSSCCSVNAWREQASERAREVSLVVRTPPGRLMFAKTCSLMCSATTHRAAQMMLIKVPHVSIDPISTHSSIYVQGVCFAGCIT